MAKRSSSSSNSTERMNVALENQSSGTSNVEGFEAGMQHSHDNLNLEMTSITRHAADILNVFDPYHIVDDFTVYNQSDWSLTEIDYLSGTTNWQFGAGSATQHSSWL